MRPETAEALLQLISPLLRHRALGTTDDRRTIRAVDIYLFAAENLDMDCISLKLKLACFAGDFNEVRRLLNLGADSNSTHEHGSSTLLTFHPAIIEYLLSRGADPNIQPNETGSSVVAGLAYMNQLECVRILLRAGADANRGRDASGKTTLHPALAMKDPYRTPLVKLLLDYGADPNA